MVGEAEKQKFDKLRGIHGSTGGSSSRDQEININPQSN